MNVANEMAVPEKEARRPSTDERSWNGKKNKKKKKKKNALAPRGALVDVFRVDLFDAADELLESVAVDDQAAHALRIVGDDVGRPRVFPTNQNHQSRVQPRPVKASYGWSHQFSTGNWLSRTRKIVQNGNEKKTTVRLKR